LAHHDLHNIRRYISFDNPQAALRLGQIFFEKAIMLSRYPEIGCVVREFSNRKIREIIVKSHRVIYRVDHSKKEVEILRYWHAARGIPNVRY